MQGTHSEAGLFVSGKHCNMGKPYDSNECACNCLLHLKNEGKMTAKNQNIKYSNKVWWFFKPILHAYTRVCSSRYLNLARESRNTKHACLRDKFGFNYFVQVAFRVF